MAHIKQKSTSSLKALQITSNLPPSQGVSPGPSIDPNETKYLLEKQARLHSAVGVGSGSKRKKSMTGGRRNEKAKVIYSSEDNEESVKLVVIQSSFTDVIQAMYTNERQSESASQK